MVAAPTLAEEILELKTQRRAMILAHHYQEAEIQELADSVGDSLELARMAARSSKATSSRFAAYVHGRNRQSAESRAHRGRSRHQCRLQPGG